MRRPFDRYGLPLLPVVAVLLLVLAGCGGLPQHTTSERDFIFRFTLPDFRERFGPPR